MTSKPASRSARATTFAPRSWPSRPGLATMIRNFSAMGVGNCTSGGCSGAHRRGGLFRRSPTRGVVPALPDGGLKDRLGEIARSSGVLEAERARTVAEIERRGAYGADGHLSITSFVEHHLQSSWWEAARTVRVARALEEHPALREALSEGGVPLGGGRARLGPGGSPGGLLRGRGDVGTGGPG